MAKGTQVGGNSKITSQRHEKRLTEKGKICNKCKQDRLESDYGTNKSWCLECLRAYQNDRSKKKWGKLW